MPRYYCDYCDTYLTHDSPSVRKQHNQGYKHKANVRSYYQQFEEQQTQSLIDQKVKEHLHMGGGFMMPGGYRPPPVLRPLSLPVPGSNPALSTPSMLPPGRPLMPPMGPNTGYMTPPTFRPPVGPQGNGLPLPPAMPPTSAPGVRPATTTTSNGTLPGPPGSYQQQPTSMLPPYNYASAPSVGAPGGYSQQQSSMNSTPSSQVSSAFGSAPPGTMPSGNYQNPQGAPTANSYGTSTVGVPPGYRG